jgi:hypothetical protein
MIVGHITSQLIDCLKEVKELRETNAELLGHIKGVVPILQAKGYKATVDILRRQIAKAEKLK